MHKIKILIVEDHPLMRQALEIAIRTQTDMEVVGQVANGLQALQRLAQVQVDVALIDLLMPKMSGIEIIPKIRVQYPELKILVVTSVDDEAEILKTVQAGVNGYLTKSAEREEIVAAIRAVYAGESFFPENITAKLLNMVRHSATGEAAQTLTPREQDVLQLLGQGLSNQQIAAQLNLAHGTVRFHMHKLMGKLGFQNRSEAVAYAVRQYLANQ